MKRKAINIPNPKAGISAPVLSLKVLFAAMVTMFFLIMVSLPGQVTQNEGPEKLLHEAFRIVLLVNKKVRMRLFLMREGRQVVRLRFRASVSSSSGSFDKVKARDRQVLTAG